jgi:hypothetical protein
VTAGHVHLGAPGENGPIVVTSFKYDMPMNEVSENGTVTADNLEGPKDRWLGSKYQIYYVRETIIRYISIFIQNRILMEKFVDTKLNDNL